MISQTTIILEQGDEDLIKMIIPKNPCVACIFHGNMGCCGCTAQTRYVEQIQPIKAAGVLEYAQKYNQLVNLRKRIIEDQAACCALEAELRNIGVEVKEEEIV